MASHSCSASTGQPPDATVACVRCICSSSSANVACAFLNSVMASGVPFGPRASRPSSVEALRRRMQRPRRHGRPRCAWREAQFRTPAFVTWTIPKRSTHSTGASRWVYDPAPPIKRLKGGKVAPDTTHVDGVIAIVHAASRLCGASLRQRVGRCWECWTLLLLLSRFELPLQRTASKARQCCGMAT